MECTSFTGAPELFINATGLLTTHIVRRVDFPLLHQSDKPFRQWLRCDIARFYNMVSITHILQDLSLSPQETSGLLDKHS